MDRGAADDGPRMNDHPQFRMWKDRLDAEMARQEEWSARRASRERARAGWYEAWRAYKARATELYKFRSVSSYGDLGICSIANRRSLIARSSNSMRFPLVIGNSTLSFDMRRREIAV